MMQENNFMGQDGFQWFVGVVEDRDDPDKTGRVRVRCLGYHSEDLNRIAVTDLPWATVMMPTTTPSMHGLGETPHFLVQGSWVLGFFRDKELQQPVIMGSLPGYNTQKPDVKKGFNDPDGFYPNKLGFNDMSTLGRAASAEGHKGLELRRRKRQTGIPIANRPNVGNVSDTATDYQPGVEPIHPATKKSLAPEKRETYDELPPKSDAPTLYPFNHVHESESGHIHEIDDTPGGGRLLRQHSTGTFEEIHPNGARVVHTMHDNYEVISGNSNIFIKARQDASGNTDAKGTLTLTVEGDMKHLVKGDYMLEVEGDYYQKIHKNHYVKIGAQGLDDGGGNREEEILGSHAIVISNAVNYTTGTAPSGPKEVRMIIGGNMWRVVTGSDKKQVNGGDYVSQVTEGDTINSSHGNMIMSTSNPGLDENGRQRGQITASAANKLNLKSATSMNLATDFDGLNINVNGVELTDNDLEQTTSTGSIFNLTVAGAANWNNTGLVTENFSASQDTNITGALTLDTTTTINTTAGTIFTIYSGGGSPSATNKVDINPS